MVRKDNAKTLFRPYAIRRFQGKKVGFIGMTLEGTPGIVSPSGIANLNFLDEAATANRYANELKRRHGVKAIVVLLHEGGVQSLGFTTNPASYTGCQGLSGPILDIVNNTTDAVDLFITGHTHQPYNCVIDGRPVTSASSAGRLISDIDLTIGRGGDVKDVQATNLPIYPEGRTPLKKVDDLVKFYEEKSRPLREREVGEITADITRATDAEESGENALGNLIADAQRTDTGANAALMNPGGVRADLIPRAPDGIVTYEEAFTVQPFNNLVTTQTFTGAQLLEVLKDQWCGANKATVLLPSDTLTYSYSKAAAAAITGDPCAGAANPVSNVTIDDAALSPTATYRITTNNFLADGGDDFPSLRLGTERTTEPEGRFDIDSLVDYLQAGHRSGLRRWIASPPRRSDPPARAAVALRHRRPVGDNPG